jgi:predicted dehydrogenase
VSGTLRVGVVGCGVISHHYAANAKAFDSFALVACADLEREAAERLASEHALPPAPVEELIGDPTIDIVLNLTPPAVHVGVTRQALAAGKHVYSEKPLALTVAEARELLAVATERGCRLACAPDTFLGSAFQTARALLDEGAIGEPLSVSAAMLVGGQASWHPNPDIFFAEGAGPLLDMGPYYLTLLVALLGPVARVAGFASTRVAEREIQVGPRAGERFRAQTPTHTAATLQLVSGAMANLVASFEAPGEYVCDFAIHGTRGVLALPDPNGFAGPLRLKASRADWVDVPVAGRGGCDSRGIGLDDLARSLVENRAHRASGELACHVVDVAESILAAAASGSAVEVATTVERPAWLPTDARPRCPPLLPTTSVSLPACRPC